MDGDPREQFFDRVDDVPVVLSMNAQRETSQNVSEGRGLEPADTGDKTSSFDTGCTIESAAGSVVPKDSDAENRGGDDSDGEHDDDDSPSTAGVE